MRRQHRSAAERAAFIEQYKASGVSVRVFASREGLGTSTFYEWLAAGRAISSGPAVRMARVIRQPAQRRADSVSPAATGATLAIELGRVRVSVRGGFDPATLNALLDVLEERRP